MEGCENYGRVFAIMYDGVANRVEEIKADWMHLVDDIGVTRSDRYLNHRGFPWYPSGDIQSERMPQ